MIRDSMVFYASFLEAAEKLPLDEKALFYEKVIRYGIRGEIIDVKNPTVDALFTLVKPNIDANNRKYVAGKRGGRPLNIQELTREEFIALDEINIDARKVPKEWREARTDRILAEMHNDVRYTDES